MITITWLCNIGQLAITTTNNEETHCSDDINDAKIFKDLLNDSNCSSDTEEEKGPEIEFEIELDKMYDHDIAMPLDSLLTPLPPWYDDSIVEETLDDIEMRPPAMKT